MWLVFASVCWGIVLGIVGLAALLGVSQKVIDHKPIPTPTATIIVSETHVN